jgi:HSP20 family molecular chaperone IbpA
METENPQSTSTSSEGASPSAPTNQVEASHPQHRGLRRSTLIIGGVAILALGMLVGIGTTKYVAGIPTAAAATTSRTNHGPTPTAQPAQAPPGAAAWNPFREIRDMQLQMDRMFDQMTSQFRLEPRLALFPDNPGYSLALRVQDLKDHYEVRAYLPNAKASDVNVSLLDKQTLRVQVSNKTTEAVNQKGTKEHVTEWGEYAQIIPLPTPVKGEQMKIDQPTHELIVTLPKA